MDEEGYVAFDALDAPDPDDLPIRGTTARAGLVVDGEIEDQHLDAALRQFGHEQFRPGQREAIRALLEARRLLLVAPTGGGKSLTYQLPALLLPGTTLVVSPLIALMHDQVASLEALGIRASFLASTLDGDEMRARLGQYARGELDLMYVAPERLFFAGFRELVARVPPPLIAIDEAHCISEWGHDFRPEYARLGEVIAELPSARVLACTATATPFVRDEIMARLGLGPETPQLVRGFARPNLVLRAREHFGKRDVERQLDAAILEALGAPENPAGSAIIYSPTRKKTEQFADYLAKGGWSVAAYHAGLSAGVRESVSESFARGELSVVVATNAFGMGIDRADVRAVVHLAPPGSIEAYYQEVGRAGRDGETAWGTLLFGAQDLPLRRRLLERDGDTNPEILEHKWNLFLELMRWAESGSCRHDAILRYFGDEEELLSGCGLCDVCTELQDEDAQDPEQVALLVRKALSGVARTHGRFGLNTTVKLLRGEDDDRLRRAGLDQVRTFGVLREHEGAWLQRVLRRLVTAGWVGFTGEMHPCVVLTEAGNEVMRERRPARVLLPQRQTRARGGSGGGASPRAKRRAVDHESLDPAASALFEALRAHRLAEAREAEIPPYMVASDRTLRDIALLKPRDLHELSLAHGIGPAKLERYGEGLLSVVAEHM